MGVALTYTPLDRVNSVADATGTKDRIYPAAASVNFFGLITEHQMLDTDLTKKNNSSVIDGSVTFVTSAIKYPIQKEDAITYGTKRYLITGFDNRVEIPSVLTCAFITEEGKA